MGKDYLVRCGWAVALAGLSVVHGAVRADDQDLRKKVIELNLVTGNDPMVGRIKVLAADPEGTKKLIQAALKEKNELQFNGALILAQVAGDLKDLKSAETFYRLCMKDGAKLQSTRKLLQSYGGLISLFYDNKKYPESARVCQELLELKTDDGKPRLVMIPVFNPRTGDIEFIDDDRFDTADRLRPAVHRLLIEAVTKQGKFEQALKLADNLIQASDHWNTRQLKGLIYREMGKYEEAAKVYEDVIERIGKDKDLQPEEKDEYQEEYRRLLIQAVAKQGKSDEAIKLVDNLIQAKDHWKTRQLKALLYREMGKYEDAAKVYEDVLERIGKDKDLRREEKNQYEDRYRYILSNIYVDAKQIDKASEQLQWLLKKYPDHPGYNNDLGYIWADNDMKFEEAEKLIRKALKGAPENGAYLDSLGWVLFKQKKYKEAKEALLKAIEDKGAQHIEIYDHLGDVHIVLGEREAALAAWRKGLEVVRADDRREQERKVSVEKKIEKHSK